MVKTIVMVKREGEEMQQIQDQGKKCHFRDGFRMANDNAKTFKKVVTKIRIP